MNIKSLLLFCSVIILNNIVVSFKNIEYKRHYFNRQLKMKSVESQCIITGKNKNIYCNKEAEDFLNKNEYVTNKKLITISPGGFKGFYLMGILTYIKENYNLDNYIYSGASAGSWNSLFMCYKGNPLEFAYSFLDYNIRKAKSITELQYFMKYKLLSTYKPDDFDLQKIFIGVTSFKNFNIRTNIFSDFVDLDDAINCCMASSHIPLITGGISNRYNNIYAFDGGFSKHPYLNTSNCVLHISPNMWNEFKKEELQKVKKTKQQPGAVKQMITSIKTYTEFFSVSKNNLLELFDHGYQDAKNNKCYLDAVFEPMQDDGVIEI